MIGYLYILATIAFTVYGQIILKWRISSMGWQPKFDGSLLAFCWDYVKFLFDPFIFSGFLSAFIASVFWMFAMTKFEITYAYPFMSLSPALVFIIGILVLNEPFTWGKLIGLLVIILGIFITVKVK
ncbi:MAG: EamA family transporter [Pleomorphochaeta sp.]